MSECYYYHMNDSVHSFHQVSISMDPIIVLDFDINGELMGIEYCE